MSDRHPITGAAAPPTESERILNPDAERSMPVRYPGEDLRPTSKKEIAGWYMYAFASEVYVICGKLRHLALATF